MIDKDLLDIIGLIYDSAVHPDRWALALNTIRLRHGWYNSSLVVMALPQQTAVVNVALNIPDSMLNHPGIIEDSITMWGGPEHMAQFPLEEPVWQSQQTDPADWVEVPFARDVGFPLGLTDQVAMTLARDRTMHAFVGFAQHESMAVNDRTIDELRFLAPHLRRAATIGRLLDNATLRAATLEATLDATQTGAVLVRGDMEIVHANGVAVEMLRGEDPIRSSNGRLQLAGELLPGHLDAAVLAAAEGAAEMGRRGIGIPSRRGDGSPLVTHVMPLAARQGARLDADAVVFLAGTGGAEPAPSQSLELLFGLTPAEVRAFELVAAGQPRRDAARAMGVAESTLKTHLSRVYNKTDRHSRADLVRLARELNLPL